MLIAVNFHYIRESFDAPYPSIFGVTPAEFEQQLDTLGRYAQFLGIDDVIAIIDGRLRMPQRAAVVTFDDGFREQYEIAWPILRAKGIPAILFVNTKPIEEDRVTTTHKIHLLRASTGPAELLVTLQEVLCEHGVELDLPPSEVAANVYKYDRPEDAQLKYFLNHHLDERQRGTIVDWCFDRLGFDEGKLSSQLYMTRDMLSELAAARVLGTHGHAHVPLGLLDRESAREDIDLSLRKLEQWTGQRVKALSYPFGFREACSQAVAEHAARNGVRFGFTMERAANEILDAPFFMSRFANNDVPGGKHCPDAEAFWLSLKHATWFRASEPADR